MSTHFTSSLRYSVNRFRLSNLSPSDQELRISRPTGPLHVFLPHMVDPKKDRSLERTGSKTKKWKTFTL